MTQDYSRTWFATFAAAFDDAARTDAEVEFLARRLPLAEFPRVLDVPSGRGRHARRLAALGYEVTAADADEAAVAASRDAVGPRGRALVADLRGLAACGGPFDAVLNLWQSFGMFKDAANAAVLAGMARRARPGGLVIVDVYDLDRFRPTSGTRRIARSEGEVVETSEFAGGRLRVRLAYSWSADIDVFDWRLFTRREFRALAESVGLALVEIGEDFDGASIGGVPRAQYVCERVST